MCHTTAIGILGTTEIGEGVVFGFGLRRSCFMWGIESGVAELM